MEEMDLVRLQFTDVFGQMKMVEMTPAQAEKAMREGYPIRRLALGEEQKGREGEEEKNSGAEEADWVYLVPDADTYRVLPWDSPQENVARMICNVREKGGQPSPLDCRSILQDTVRRAGEMGLEAEFRFQCEFYLFHTDDDGRPTTITHEVAGYYDAGLIDLADGVRRDILLSLREAGMEAECAYHGLTPGQHCFLLPARPGVEAADYLQTFRSGVKRIAKRHGLHAAFMPNPVAGGDGSGLHVEIRLRKTEKRDGTPASETENQLFLQQAELFAGGIERNLRDMLIFTNPTVNSFKRLAKLKGRERNGAGLGCPGGNSAGKKPGEDFASAASAVSLLSSGERDAVLRITFPDPSCNPYLALTALLAGGMKGLSGEQRERRAFPDTLGCLLQEFPENRFAREAMGERFCLAYEAGKRREWERFCSHVTDWEMAEYLFRC